VASLQKIEKPSFPIFLVEAKRLPAFLEGIVGSPAQSVGNL